MKDSDLAIRCNIVTLSEEEHVYEEKTVLDHSASEISTEEAAVLINAIKDVFHNEQFQFYVGTSYRHLCIWNKGKDSKMIPPHDILGKKAGAYLPEENLLKEMMKKSYDILNQHPVNIKRAQEGKNKANSLWFWGAGSKPYLDSFEERTGKKGVMISAVDLLKGIAAGASMTNIHVEGADGTLYTNYEGKAHAAVEAVLHQGYDFAYIHVEAPDEMGHQGNLSYKIQAIEALDKQVIQVVKEEMDRFGQPYRLLVMPDHPTPLHLRTHTSDPVPYLLYDSTNQVKKEGRHYNEKEAKESGIAEKEGYKLIEKFLEICHDGRRSSCD